MLQRVPRNECDPLAITVVNDGLPHAIDQVVAVLHGSDREEAARAFDLLDVHLRQADVPDLAVLSREMQEAELIFFGDVRIDPVQLVQIDTFQPQPPQAAVQLFAQAFGSPVGLPLAGAGPIESTLGGDDETPRVAVQRLRNQLFADVRPVGFRRVDEVHVELDRASQHGDRLVVVGGRPDLAGPRDAHRAEPEAMNRQIPAQSECPAERSAHRLRLHIIPFSLNQRSHRF